MSNDKAAKDQRKEQVREANNRAAEQAKETERKMEEYKDYLKSRNG